MTVGASEAKYVVVKKAKLSMWGKVKQSLLEMFPANATADVEDMHKGGWAVTISFMKQLAFVVVLAIFWWQNTDKEIKKSFLSLTGNSSAQTCATVANPLNSNFQGDRFGYWESQSNFLVSGGFYELIFKGSEVNNETYMSVMKTFEVDLKRVSDKCEKGDLSVSLLALSTWAIRDPSTAMELTTNADLATMLSNFEFVDAGVFTPEGKAENTAGTLGGGVGGYSYSLSPDSKFLQFSFPLSQCIPQSQVKNVSVTSSFRARASAATRTLTVLPATATLSMTTLGHNSSEVDISPTPGGGTTTNDMQISWKDAGYDPNTVYVLQFCEDYALIPPPSGKCTVRSKAQFKSSFDVVSNTITVSSTSSGVLTDGMTILGLGSRSAAINTVKFEAHSGDSMPGDLSKTLIIESTTSNGQVANGLMFHTGVYDVILSGCSIASNAGTCTMSSYQAISLDTKFDGTAKGITAGSVATVNNCKLFAQFDASTTLITAADTGTGTLTVSSVDSGTLSSGDYFYFNGNKWILTVTGSCTNGGVCSYPYQDVSNQGYQGYPVIASGTKIAVRGTTLYISKVTSGEVVSGMQISDGATNTYTLSGCTPTPCNTFSTSCTCTLSAAAILYSSFAVSGSGTCSINFPSGGNIASFADDDFVGYKLMEVNLPMDTIISGTATVTSSISPNQPVDEGAIVDGLGVPKGTVLSNCQRWVRTSEGYVLKPCAVVFTGMITANSRSITDVHEGDGLKLYQYASNSTLPKIGMFAKCQIAGCGIPPNAHIVAITQESTTSVKTTITLNTPMTKTSSIPVKVVFSGLSDRSTVYNGIVGTFTTSTPFVSPDETMQAVSSCKQARQGTAGFLDPSLFSPPNNFNYQNRDGANTLNIEFDLQSISTAVSINYGIVKLSALSQVNVSNPQSFDSHDKGKFYIDPRNKPMEPIFCLTESNDKSASCLVSQKNFLFYPVVLSIDPKDGAKCECAASGDETMNEKEDPTKTFCDLVPQVTFALIFYPDNLDGHTNLGKRDGNTGNKYAMKFAAKMKNLYEQGGGSDESSSGDLNIIDFVYPTIAATYKQDYFGPEGTFTGFRDMCYAGAGTKRCGIFKAEFHVTADQFMSVNTNGMQLTALQTGNRLYPLWPSANDPDLYYSIACTNPIYVPEALAKLTSRPPVSLVQPYQKCSSTVTAAVQTAFGSASGSANAISGGVVSVLLAVAIIFINRKLAKKSPPEPAILPPLKKGQKKEKMVLRELAAVKAAINALLDVDDLAQLSKEKRQKIRSEFVDALRELADDEERVPAAVAERQNLELVDLDEAIGSGDRIKVKAGSNQSPRQQRPCSP